MIVNVYIFGTSSGGARREAIHCFTTCCPLLAASRVDRRIGKSQAGVDCSGPSSVLVVVSSDNSSGYRRATVLPVEVRMLADRNIAWLDFLMIVTSHSVGLS